MRGLVYLPDLLEAPALDPHEYESISEAIQDVAFEMDEIKEEFGDTEYVSHYQKLAEWANEYVARVDSECNFSDGDSEAIAGDCLTLRLWGDTKPAASPFVFEIDYHAGGEVGCRLLTVPNYDRSWAEGTQVPWTDRSHELRETDVELDYDGTLTTSSINEIWSILLEEVPYVTGRVQELYEEGGIPLSQARTRALKESGCSEEEISRRLDVGERTVSSYQSKYRQTAREIRRAFLATAGPPMRIVASNTWEWDEQPVQLFVAIPNWYDSNVDLPNGTQASIPGAWLIEFPPVQSRWDFQMEVEAFDSLSDLLSELDERAENESYQGYGPNWNGLRQQIPRVLRERADQPSRWWV